MDLFDIQSQPDLSKPLAEKLRPEDFSDFIGMDELLKKGNWLRASIERDQFPSLIFWGPPGTGKTTLARIISKKTKRRFVSVNAISTGSKELREICESSKNHKKIYQEETVLFIDEIHRLNKSQQDVLLPYVESADILLIGATTENPSFEINKALLSRLRVISFKRLSLETLNGILLRALANLNYKEVDLFKMENLSSSHLMEAQIKNQIKGQSESQGRGQVGEQSGEQNSEQSELALSLDQKNLKFSSKNIKGLNSEGLSSEGLSSKLYLLELADGDARRLLNRLEELIHHHESLESSSSHKVNSQGALLEQASQAPLGGSSPSLNCEATERNLQKGPYSVEDLKKILGSKKIFHDKSGELHYDTISAFIKSIRGSDPTAGLYYLARLVEAGEDPKFIARRLVILASEDIGNADPRALTLAMDGFRAVEVIGLPECGINLAQVVVYLCCAPKSNSSYVGYKRALEEVKRSGLLDIPKSIKNAVTGLLKKEGYGEGYSYAHEGERGWMKQEFLPQEISHLKLYESKGIGYEKKMEEYLRWMKGLPKD